MAVTIFAAIDVGSYEVSMDIYQISPKIGIEKIDEVRSRIELGHDTYTNGKISYESAQRLGEVLGDFSRIMKEYKVTSYRACATSTLQEARNVWIVLEQVYQKTGIRVEILSNSEQRFFGYKSIAAKEADFSKIIQKGTAIIEIGGGNVQISLFDKYQVLFGFGQSTNVDLPGEPSDDSLSGLVFHADNLSSVSLAVSSFGQGVTTSMMQVGTAFCSAINGGYYYEPSVVQRIEDENGNIVENREPVLVRRTISEDVSAQMRQFLKSVVTDGTGKKAAVEGYEVGGKTGTAEKLPRGNGKYILSFIGFAPVDNPQVVIYVVADEPELQSGSGEAAHLFSDIAQDIFPYMNIYKTDESYDIDAATAEDEPATPIYDGTAPTDDVAGGSNNPYVEQSGGDTSATTESGTTTESTDTTTSDTTTEAPVDTTAETPTG